MNNEFLKKLLEQNDITVEKIGKWFWVSGNTKPMKEELKANKFRWSHNKKMWYFHEGRYRKYGNQEYTIDDIKEKYQSQILRSVEVV